MRRLIQIDSVDLAVFVEGWSDREFYDGVCEAALAGLPITFEVRTAEEVSGASGGKSKLLSLFESFRDSDSLLGSFKGRPVAAIFFLDKDLDDLAGSFVTSNHVVYTEHYHFENYIYIAGDLIRASSAASQLDRATVRKAIGNPNEWRLRAARQWQRWIELAVHTQLHAVPRGCRMRARSLINRGFYGGVSHDKYEQELAHLRNTCKICLGDFDQNHQVIVDAVSHLFAVGKHDAVFCGKWYPHFLGATMRSASEGKNIQRSGLEGRIESGARSTVNYNESWADPLKEPVRAIAQSLMST